jgi:hypothetical protein
MTKEAGINKPFNEFIAHFMMKLHENRLKIKNFMSEGVFTWYKPISGSDVEPRFLEFNKLVVKVFDDANLKRLKKRSIKEVNTEVVTFQNYEPQTV